jgi:hypothetical protein
LKQVLKQLSDLKLAILDLMKKALKSFLFQKVFKTGVVISIYWFQKWFDVGVFYFGVDIFAIFGLATVLAPFSTHWSICSTQSSGHTALNIRISG